jgi:hypothetical protein
MFNFIIYSDNYFILILEILIPYLPSTPKCLELFARYLLPNWTSYGLEALKFQHQFLYENSDMEYCNHKSNIKSNENV